MSQDEYQTVVTLFQFRAGIAHLHAVRLPHDEPEALETFARAIRELEKIDALLWDRVNRIVEWDFDPAGAAARINADWNAIRATRGFPPPTQKSTAEE